MYMTHHRLNDSLSLVLTATLHSYHGSLIFFNLGPTG